tara:strand:- start:51 stop:263 length:213 start_codon:yes stop_codon:yes gene_type:complete
MTTTLTTDYVKEMQFFYNDKFVISDSYTVVEPGLSEFSFDESITHNQLNNYMSDNKDFKLESIIVLPELS